MKAIVPIANEANLTETYTVVGSTLRPSAFLARRDQNDIRIVEAVDVFLLIEQASYTTAQSDEIVAEGGEVFADDAAFNTWYTENFPVDYDSR